MEKILLAIESQYDQSINQYFFPSELIYINHLVTKVKWICYGSGHERDQSAH